MVVTGNNQSTRTKICPGTTPSTTNPTRTGLLLNPGLHSREAGD